MGRWFTSGRGRGAVVRRLAVCLLVFAAAAPAVGTAAAAPSPTPGPALSRAQAAWQTYSMQPEGRGPGAYDRPFVARTSLPPGTPLGDYGCDGYFGVDSLNPPSEAMQDILHVTGFQPVKVGDGTGNVDWTLNPYNHYSWTLWLHTLRWIGSLLQSYETTGDTAHLDHAVAVTKDWLADNSVPDRWHISAVEGRAHRTHVLLCLHEDIGNPQWLVDALDLHAQYLEAHFSGLSNHGLDETLALFGVGCELGRRDYTDFAVDRLNSMIGGIVDTQGVTNEQSVGYQVYNYLRLLAAEAKLGRCGYTVSAEMAARRDRMPEFQAHSTMPDGFLPQIGDSAVQPQVNFPGTLVEYAATKGASGVPPRDRAKIYTAGYAFGRSSWSPYTSASWYALRFGPVRFMHGHFDHTSLLYYARGRRILTHGGFVGYEASPRASYLRGPDGHNVMTVPGATLQNVPTALTRSSIGATADFYEVSDQQYASVTRTRSVLMARGPDVAVVLDRVASPSLRQYQQLWHLTPDNTVTVAGRNLAAAVPADKGSRTYLIQVPLPGQTLPAGSTQVVKGQTTPRLQGWVAEQPYVFQPAPVVTMTRFATSTAWLTLVIPTRYNATVSYSIRQGADRYYTLSLVVDGKPVTVRISGGGWMGRTA